ncbi:MAG TPA: hypothetical protein VMG12_42985 [Polyangiaceae bacterium]|nr:hypothetical protein [Polyangiaceae bacterium]
MAAGCAANGERYPPREPLWRDPDRAPFAASLPEYDSPVRWPAVDQSLTRPVSQLFAVDPGGEARNVNAWDEVPDSSWFTQRIGRGPLSPAAAALGPCPQPLLDGAGPWQIVSAKVDGATAGFVIEAPSGERYLIKFDDRQGPRATLADVVASRLYWAAGYDVPCYDIVFFSRSILGIGPRAKGKNAFGERVPLTWDAIDIALDKAIRLPDGRYRAVASLYLRGRPLGPWRYHGTREGDRNDIIPHEDRRELRASRLLAAWVDHSDQRDGNTLSMWIETGPGVGFVRHHLLDFGDCFGHIWAGPAELAWRREHVYFFDPWQLLGDFVTLGARERPWDRARFGESGMVFAYYRTEGFDPEAWRPSYPNPAFGRMTERDGAWMARIIARFDERQLAAIIAMAEVDPGVGYSLFQTLMGRRSKILERYLSRLSPLADPVVRNRDGRVQICLRDLAVATGVAAARQGYWARARRERQDAAFATVGVELVAAGQPCVTLPAADAAGAQRPSEVTLEVGVAAQTPTREGAVPQPLRLHVYLWRDRTLIAGVERSP